MLALLLCNPERQYVLLTNVRCKSEVAAGGLMIEFPPIQGRELEGEGIQILWG